MLVKATTRTEKVYVPVWEIQPVDNKIYIRFRDAQPAQSIVKDAADGLRMGFKKKIRSGKIYALMLKDVPSDVFGIAFGGMDRLIEHFPVICEYRDSHGRYQVHQNLNKNPDFPIDAFVD